MVDPQSHVHNRYQVTREVRAIPYDPNHKEHKQREGAQVSEEHKLEKLGEVFSVFGQSEIIVRLGVLLLLHHQS